MYVRILQWCAPAVCLVSAAVAGAQNPAAPADAAWKFKTQLFLIGSLRGPEATDEKYAAYKANGLNVVVTPQFAYAQSFEDVDRALDLAQKHGLAAVLDTLTSQKSGKTWGGKPGEWYRPVDAHPPTLAQFQWIQERYGKHPALAGYLLADDFVIMPPRVVESTRWLRENAPQLWPCVSQMTFAPEYLMSAEIPIAMPQLYGALRSAHRDPVKRMEFFCDQVQEVCRERPSGLVPWPVLNLSTWDGPLNSDSVLRFQTYTAVAYGAQGIWYPASDGPLEGFQREINQSLLAWGPTLLGRATREVYQSGWGDWQDKGYEAAGQGKLIAGMTEHLLVGILRKEGEAPLAMVVDKRIGDHFRTVPPRDAEITFSGNVNAIDVFEGAAAKNVPGPTVKLRLKGGGGQLLRLIGKDL